MRKVFALKKSAMRKVFAPKNSLDGNNWQERPQNCKDKKISDEQNFALASSFNYLMWSISASTKLFAVPRQPFSCRRRRAASYNNESSNFFSADDYAVYYVLESRFNKPLKTHRQTVLAPVNALQCVSYGKRKCWPFNRVEIRLSIL